MLLHMFREEETNDKQDFSLRHGYITCTYIIHTYMYQYVHGAMCSTSHTISSQHMHFFTHCALVLSSLSRCCDKH